MDGMLLILKAVVFLGNEKKCFIFYPTFNCMIPDIYVGKMPFMCRLYEHFNLDVLLQFPHKYRRSDDFERISRKERDDAGHHSRSKRRVCTDHKPCGTEGIASGEAADHRKGINRNCRAGRSLASGHTRDDQADDQRSDDVADNVSARRTCKYAQAASESGEYRKADSAGESIDDQADRSVFFAQKPTGQKYSQSSEVNRYRCKSKRDRYP